MEAFVFGQNESAFLITYLNLVLDNVKLLDNYFHLFEYNYVLKQTHLHFSGSFCPQPCWPRGRNVRFLHALGDPEPISRKFYVFCLVC